MTENGVHEHNHDHQHDHHHGHDHGHDHEHSHGHSHGEAPASPEERMALLKYMLNHNAHHAEELHDLAQGTAPEVSALIHEAVADIEASNEKLREAIEKLEG